MTAFQIGWTVLHDEVCVRSAADFIEVLQRLRVPDRERQAALDGLRRELSRHVRTGTPWQAAPAIDVIAELDPPAWAALRGLLGECPVMHAALAASLASSPRAIDPGAFEFVSENAQILRVHEFLHLLPAALRP